MEDQKNTEEYTIVTFNISSVTSEPQNNDNVNVLMDFFMESKPLDTIDKIRLTKSLGF